MHRPYAAIAGACWAVFGGVRVYAVFAAVAANGLGRFAPNFGLSWLPGHTATIPEDVFLFAAVLLAARLLVVSGLLLALPWRPANYTGVAGAGSLFLLNLAAILDEFNVLALVGPAGIPLTAVFLQVALRKRRAPAKPA